MRETERGERYVVFDDFLTGAAFDVAVDQLARAKMSVKQSVISPELDGHALRSDGISFPSSIGDGRPSGRPALYTRIAQVVHSEHQIFGKAGIDWDRLTFTFWKYPAGSRLGWHNDAGGGRRGEFILFLHREWDIAWGGELMLIDRDPVKILDTCPVTEQIIADHPLARLGRILRECEVSPRAILPRPNRLVLVQANTVHTVRRVDQTATDHLRCTLTGFAFRETSDRRDTNKERLKETLLEKIQG